MLTAQEFEQLLPWYVNGSLSEAEHALVRGYLDTHPDEQARVRRHESLRGAIKRRSDELPEDIGFQRAVSAIRPEAAAGLIRRRARASAATSIGKHLQEAEEAPIAAREGQITQRLARVRGGDRGARDELFALTFGDLEKLAKAHVDRGERKDMPDTATLVHEAYLRFIRSSAPGLEDCRYFFASASRVMRGVIVDAARARLAQRQLLDHVAGGEEAILEVESALRVLEEAEPRLARVVEMRYYGGYTDEEIAATLGVTERAVQRDWKKASLLLKAALARD